MAKVRERNLLSMPIKLLLAAAVLAVPVSAFAQVCRTGFVERIDRITQKSECIPQNVIRQQALKRSQATRAVRIRREQAVQQQARIRAQRAVKRKQASRAEPGLSAKKRRLKQKQVNKQKLDRQRKLALRQQIGSLISEFKQRQPSLTRRQESRGEEIIRQPKLLQNKLTFKQLQAVKRKLTELLRERRKELR